MLHITAWVLHHCATIDPELFPIGYVDDNAEHTWEMVADFLEMLARPLIERGTIEIDRRRKVVKGFFRGIDVIHVLWRLWKGLDGSSHDFLRAAFAARSGMSHCFNPVYDKEDTSSGSETDNEDTPEEPNVLWQTLWLRWCNYGSARRNKVVGDACLQAYLSVATKETDPLKLFRNDGAVPPRGLIHNFLKGCGVEKLHEKLWRGGSWAALWKRDLVLFGKWFSAATSDHAPRGRVRLYRKMHRRVKLAREDSTTGETVKKPAINAEWAEIVENQTKNVVVEGLLASRELKETLVDVYGPKAVSLGTVAVEAIWWQHLLRNINRAAVWATPPWREYHQVQSWKKDVVTILRKLMSSSDHREAASFKQSSHEILCLLSDCDRDVVNFPSSKAKEIADGEGNCGFDAFVKEMAI